MTVVMPERSASTAPRAAATLASSGVTAIEYGHMNSHSQGQMESPSPSPRARDWKRWLCPSVKPGTTARPRQSTVRAACHAASVSAAGPTAAMRFPVMATEPGSYTDRRPSTVTTRPPDSRRSHSMGASRSSWQLRHTQHCM